MIIKNEFFIKQLQGMVEDNRQILTYSSLSDWLNCRRKSFYRVKRKLVRPGRNITLDFGSVIHAGVEQWHSSYSFDKVQKSVDTYLIKNGMGYDDTLELVTKVRAMLEGYTFAYPNDQQQYKVIGAEIPFYIRLPSQWQSKYAYAGKIDGLWQDILTGKYYILENKTAATIDGNYLAKLWNNWQNILYATFFEQCYNIPIAGVIYNILAKNKLEMKGGESDYEWQERVANAKQPKRLKRKMAETEIEFYYRLMAFHNNAENYHREEILIDSAKRLEVEEELYTIIGEYDRCNSENLWYCNRARCYDFYRACPYAPLCEQSGDTSMLEELLFVHEELHSELREDMGMINSKE